MYNYIEVNTRVQDLKISLRFGKWFAWIENNKTHSTFTY